MSGSPYLRDLNIMARQMDHVKNGMNYKLFEFDLCNPERKTKMVIFRARVSPNNSRKPKET